MVKCFVKKSLMSLQKTTNPIDLSLSRKIPEPSSLPSSPSILSIPSIPKTPSLPPSKCLTQTVGAPALGAPTYLKSLV